MLSRFRLKKNKQKTKHPHPPQKKNRNKICVCLIWIIKYMNLKENQQLSKLQYAVQEIAENKE